MKNPINTMIASFIIFSSMIAGANQNQQLTTAPIEGIIECLSVSVCQKASVHPITPDMLNIINQNVISSMTSTPILKAHGLVFSGFVGSFTEFSPYGNSQSILFESEKSDTRFGRFKTVGISNHSDKNLDVIILVQDSVTSQLQFYAKITVQPKVRDFIYLKNAILPHKVYFRFSTPVSNKDFSVLYQ